MPPTTRRSPMCWATGTLVAVLLGFAPALAAAATGPGGDDEQRPRASSSQRQPGRLHSFSATFSADWLGSSSLGTSTASETSNDGGQPLAFFRAEGRLQWAPGLEARVAYALTPVISVEGGVAYSRPAVQVSISNDFENAASTTFENAERLSQYLVDVAGLIHLPGLGFAHQRAVPFLEVGAGYLRQLHEGQTLVETGQVYYLGGGLKYFFLVRPTSRITGLGFRADARAAYCRQGYSFDDKARIFPVLSAGIVLAF